jgi:hypothetical protein
MGCSTASIQMEWDAGLPLRPIVHLNNRPSSDSSRAGAL